MVFDSATFLVFLAAVIGLYALPLAWNTRKLILLLASYLFYGAWNPPFLILLVFTTVVDWLAARGMARWDTAPGIRRVLLVVSLSANLGLLGFFKYAEFLLEAFVGLMRPLGIEFEPLRLGIVLPVGISFYTFQTMSYVIDVYRRRIPAWPSFLDYCLYVTFFPQLVAGPIVRGDQFLDQCREPKRLTAEQVGWGAALLVLGLFAKVVLADGALAPVADQVYDMRGQPGAVDAWLGTLAFAGQIYFDFAGYSLCAIGAALLLGFHIPRNFRLPYAAVGFADFWRRWHISLSTWLRDYLYVPLGGNRAGRLRRNLNVWAVMLLGGLWHGASWRFVAWGALHAAFLSLERLVRGDARRETAPGGWRGFSLAMATFAGVCFSWTLFRAPTIRAARGMAASMAGTAGLGPVTVAASQAAGVVVITAITLGGGWLMRDSSVEAVLDRSGWLVRAVLLVLALCAIMMAPRDARDFIYFQF